MNGEGANPGDDIRYVVVFFDNSGIWAATFSTIPRTGSSAPTEGMLNPLWPGLEVVMAGTSPRFLYHQTTRPGYICYKLEWSIN